jgi:uncharacterized protein YdeI (YjbR/CyaY-like superfamily)
MNPKVDAYIEKKGQPWQEPILKSLRQSILGCGLTEEIKWGGPAYTHHGNVVGIGAFKKHVALWFFEGETLKDEQKVLMNAQEEKTSGMRQWPFEEGDTVNQELVGAYVSEAALNMEKGVKAPKKKIEVVVPDLLQDALDGDSKIKTYFDSLAPSHRRGFAEHISEAKREETKLRRLEKVVGLLSENKTLHDKYKNC